MIPYLWNYIQWSQFQPTEHLSFLDPSMVGLSLDYCCYRFVRIPLRLSMNPPQNCVSHIYFQKHHKTFKILLFKWSYMLIMNCFFLFFFCHREKYIVIRKSLLTCEGRNLNQPRPKLELLISSTEWLYWKE